MQPAVGELQQDMTLQIAHRVTAEEYVLKAQYYGALKHAAGSEGKMKRKVFLMPLGGRRLTCHPSVFVFGRSGREALSGRRCLQQRLGADRQAATVSARLFLRKVHSRLSGPFVL